jgi:hypothetical protein
VAGGGGARYGRRAARRRNRHHRTAHRCRPPLDPAAAAAAAALPFLPPALPSCQAASAEHERCFTSVVNTGGYKGQPHCRPQLDALKAGLKRHGLFPFPA